MGDHCGKAEYNDCCCGSKFITSACCFPSVVCDDMVHGSDSLAFAGYYMGIIFYLTYPFCCPCWVVVGTCAGCMGLCKGEK